jgi:hypothetical protein
VQSRKKKSKKVKMMLQNSAGHNPVRRSKRIVPSIYRSRGVRKILYTPKRSVLKRIHHERPILEL